MNYENKILIMCFLGFSEQNTFTCSDIPLHRVLHKEKLLDKN